MPKTDTKNRILTECLALFSKHGYDGVSMRDIARAVGFRESALYKHYKSKREILDCIFIVMKARFEEASKAISLPDDTDFSVLAEEYKNGGLDGLKKQCSSLFLYWLKDEQAAQFRRLLMLEQFKSVDSEVLALQFYSPIFLLLCKYDGQPEKESEALSLLERFVETFDAAYRNEE